MSRKLRIEYPGARYHVMNRGDEREDIFRDDDDREKFLCTRGEACAKSCWRRWPTTTLMWLNSPQ
jgi:REP element-mobilizing transposase RayT